MVTETLQVPEDALAVMRLLLTEHEPLDNEYVIDPVPEYPVADMVYAIPFRIVALASEIV
jgi:hypothetical protein